MKRKRLIRLTLSLARYIHELEQITLRDQSAAADVAAATRRMNDRHKMWREAIEGLAANNPRDR